MHISFLFQAYEVSIKVIYITQVTGPFTEVNYRLVPEYRAIFLGPLCADNLLTSLSVLLSMVGNHRGNWRIICYYTCHHTDFFHFGCG